MDVYRVYVWEGDRLRHVADNIVGQDREAAQRNAIFALRKRPKTQGDVTLLELANYYFCGQTFPAGVKVIVEKVAPGPKKEGPDVVFV